MTKAQKALAALREKQSKARQRMAEIGLDGDLTDETRAELDDLESATPDLERQIRAATVAVEQEEAEQKTEQRAGEPDAEMRERIELRSKVSAAEYLMARAQQRLPSGAAAELQAAAWPDGRPDTAGPCAIPLELWDVPERRDRQDGERRDVTDAPGTVGVNLDAIRPAVFANAVLPRLGVEMPRVASGTFATATITTSQTAAAKAKSAAAAATAGGFTVTTATPKRVSARLELTLEDIAAVGQANFESILRENLSLVLSNALDDQGLNGNGTAPNLAGFFNRLGAPTAPSAGVDGFDDFLATLAGGIDGLWAGTLEEVAAVVGPATYENSVKSFRDDEGARGAMGFATYAKEHTGGWWTNKRMPDPDSSNHIQNAILYRKGRSMMGGSGAMRTAVCPHWNAVDIDDIYTGSAKAERYFTMHVLLGDVILTQPDAYKSIAFRTAV